MQERRKQAPKEQTKAKQPPAEQTELDLTEEIVQTEGPLQNEIAEPASEPETVSATDNSSEDKAIIERLQGEMDENIALLQRLQADFDNYRKRNMAIRADSLEEGASDIVRELLPFMDNFERALAATDEIENDSYLKGFEMVYRQLKDILQKLGLSEIPTQGAFDPELHEAVMQEVREDLESGMVSEVLQKGYRFKERIIRHSLVKVAQ